ncbi:MAG: hypothetical protein VB875_07630, partial [Pirellulales bacterium]
GSNAALDGLGQLIFKICHGFRASSDTPLDRNKFAKFRWRRTIAEFFRFFSASPGYSLAHGKMLSKDGSMIAECGVSEFADSVECEDNRKNLHISFK